MNKSRLIAVAALLGLVFFFLQRELFRGTFDSVERAFVGWLSANTGGKNALPALTLVLCDDEASQLAGAPRMGTLDAALFARAAARLGAVAAGVEGLPGDPSRMLDAAGPLRLFAGYAPENPPGAGWTPLPGTPQPQWLELRGGTGPESTRLPRGFFAVPEGGSGPRRARMVARLADRVVPSFLAVAWSSAQDALPSQIDVQAGWIECTGRALPIDDEGNTSFFASPPPQVLTMNEMLVIAEKFERSEAGSPLRGHVVVLARATADVARVKTNEEAVASAPSELWAGSWTALRQGRCFLLPGWWYGLASVAGGLLLAFGSVSRKWPGCAGLGLAALFLYLLASLGAFASAGLLLPFVPSVATLAAGLFLGRFLLRT